MSPSILLLNNLKDLNCSGNKLETLSVAGKAALQTLNCYNNKLTTIAFDSYNSKLETVNCYGNKLTTFTLTGRSALKTLNISNNPTLTSLQCYNNALTSLNVSGNTALTDLRCYGNTNLATITGIANCTALQKLYCYNCALTDLSAVSGMTNLDYLSCYGNKLTSLTVQNKSKLTSLYCYNNPNMATLTVTGNSALKTLDAKSNTALTTLNCYNNALTSLSVTGNTKMTTLYCYNNQLTSLSVSNCSALKTLYCYKNKISGTGMTTLVNSLPTRSTSARGILRAVYNSGESNSMTTAQITTARNKYWTPYKYTGSGWVEMTGIEDRIWMDNVEGDPGVYVNVPVTLQNSETVSSIEFDVYYPTGFSALASKGARLTDGSTVTNSTTSGYRHVAITNMNTDVIVQEAGSGIICYVRVKAPATASSGQYELGLRNINLVLASGSKTLSNCSATFTVRGKVGDVNNDGEVNITDVNCIIGVILGKPDTYGGRADVNHDDEVNITDVNEIGRAHV